MKVSLGAVLVYICICRLADQLTGPGPWWWVINHNTHSHQHWEGFTMRGRRALLPFSWCLFTESLTFIDIIDCQWWFPVDVLCNPLGFHSVRTFVNLGLLWNLKIKLIFYDETLKQQCVAWGGRLQMERLSFYLNWNVCVPLWPWGIFWWTVFGSFCPT